MRTSSNGESVAQVAGPAQGANRHIHPTDIEAQAPRKPRELRLIQSFMQHSTIFYDSKDMIGHEKAAIYVWPKICVSLNE